MGVFQKIFGSVIDAAIGKTFDNAMMPHPKRRTPASEAPPKPKEFSIESLKKVVGATRDKLLSDLDRSLRDAAAKQEAEHQRADDSRAREPWYRFIYLGIPLVRGVDFESSNVQWVYYDVEHTSLYIEYIKNGCTYRYWPVSEREAVSIFNSVSKGIWVWSNLRIRGTKLGHRKNYMLTSGSPGGGMPMWTGSAGSIQAHDEQVGTESGASGPHNVLGLGQTAGQPLVSPPYKALGKFQLTKPKLN